VRVDLPHLDRDLGAFAGEKILGHDDLLKSSGLNSDVELASGRSLDFELTLWPGNSLD
jgi:hypothetical protein